MMFSDVSHKFIQSCRADLHPDEPLVVITDFTIPSIGRAHLAAMDAGGPSRS